MPIHVGQSEVNDIRVGETRPRLVYAGTTIIWSSLTPAAPVLTAELDTSTSSVNLTVQTAPNDNGEAITGYEWQVDRVPRNRAGDPPDWVGARNGTATARDNQPPVIFTRVVYSPLRRGSYFARIRAVNANGEGAWSNVVEVPS